MTYEDLESHNQILEAELKALKEAVRFLDTDDKEFSDILTEIIAGQISTTEDDKRHAETLLKVLEGKEQNT